MSAPCPYQQEDGEVEGMDWPADELTVIPRTDRRPKGLLGRGDRALSGDRGLPVVAVDQP